jgi:hypothetical protein
VCVRCSGLPLPIALIAWNRLCVHVKSIPQVHTTQKSWEVGDRQLQDERLAAPGFGTPRRHRRSSWPSCRLRCTGGCPQRPCLGAGRTRKFPETRRLRALHETGHDVTLRYVICRRFRPSHAQWRYVICFISVGETHNLSQDIIRYAWLCCALPVPHGSAVRSLCCLAPLRVPCAQCAVVFLKICCLSPGVFVVQAMAAADREARARLCAVRLDYVQDDVVVGGASGTHYGGGWIITNSHVVGVKAAKLSSIQLQFGDGTILAPRSRLCFFFTIPPVATMEHQDLAFFSLDEDELGRISFELSLTAFIGDARAFLAFPPSATPLATVGEGSRCYHFGWALDVHGVAHRPPHVLDSVEVVSAVTSSVVPGLHHIIRTGGNTCGGASGAAVYGADHRLVGVHFGGGKADDGVVTGVAVAFNPTVAGVLRGLVGAIADVHRVQQLRNLAKADPSNDDARADLHHARWLLTERLNDLAIVVVIPV